MTETNSFPCELTLHDATEADIPALSTIFTRSYYPISEYMRKAFPNTETVRKWWEDVNEYALRNPDIRLVKVESSDTSLISMCRWRKYPSTFDEKGDISAGTWSLISPSEDHDADLCKAFIDYLAEMHVKFMATQDNKNSKYVQYKPHILIELLLTDHEHKKRGAAKLILQQLCHEADEQQLPCFVETNDKVVTFYEQFGFGVLQREVMPGDMGLEEFVMVREPRSV